MNAIHIQSKDNNFKALVIYCDDKNTHSVFGFLEGTDAVKAYKVIFGEVGVLDEKNLKIFYPGYVCPQGKLVEHFDWN